MSQYSRLFVIRTDKVTADRTDHTVLSSWPVEQKVYLTLDLECDYGTALTDNTYDAARQTPVLVNILESHDVPVTVFLQTEVLDAAPEAVQSLRDAKIPVEFHAHSVTHPRRRDADVVTEVSESVDRIRSMFDRDCVGYRFPDGAARADDYEVLADHEVPFNASLFPSWRPGRFDNTDRPLTPFRHQETGVVELPFTVSSRRIRIPVALSYLKLLGRPYQWRVHRNPPSAIVFDMHMHDLVKPSVYSNLDRFYRAVYARRSSAGCIILAQFIEAMQSHKYSFGLMSDLHDAVDKRLDT